MPNKKVTINLAPADRRKEGAAFDFPIAIGILVADDLVSFEPLEGLLLMGELGLDGSLRPIRGALSAALLARDRGMRGILLPAQSAAEAAAVEDIEVYGVSHLSEVVAFLQRDKADAGGESVALTRVPPPRPGELGAGEPAPCDDMSEVRGQQAARTAIEVAVAGGHNLLLTGRPGSARRCSPGGFRRYCRR